jgi:hypothetical protein
VYLGMKILQNEVTGTQTNFFTNFGGELSFIQSFLFFLSASSVLHIFSLAPYPYNYYNYSRTLCIKCWVSAFHTKNEFHHLAKTTERGDRGWKRRWLYGELLYNKTRLFENFENKWVNGYIYRSIYICHEDHPTLLNSLSLLYCSLSHVLWGEGWRNN